MRLLWSTTGTCPSPADHRLKTVCQPATSNAITSLHARPADSVRNLWDRWAQLSISSRQLCSRFAPCLSKRGLEMEAPVLPGRRSSRIAAAHPSGFKTPGVGPKRSVKKSDKVGVRKGTKVRSVCCSGGRPLGRRRWRPFKSDHPSCSSLQLLVQHGHSVQSSAAHQRREC